MVSFWRRIAAAVNQLFQSNVKGYPRDTDGNEPIMPTL